MLEDNFNPFVQEPKQVDTEEETLSSESGENTTVEDKSQINPQVDPQDPNGKRFTYFQSLADQYKNELEKVKPYIPIVEYIRENPDVIDYIEQKASPQQKEVIEKPTMPQKPSNYDPNDFDPSGESFKYRQLYEEYLGKMNDYILKKQESIESYLSSIEKQKVIEQQKNQELNNIAMYLKTNYKYSDNDVNEFINVFSNPKSLTIDNLVMLDRIRKGNFKQQRIDNPSPAGVFGSFNTPKNSDEDLFNASLAKMSWKNNPNLMRRPKK